MRCEFIKKNGTDNLTIFFAGWGMDASDFDFLNPNESDLLICSDYREMSFDAAILKPYQNIRLVAYSLGVWAAAYTFCDLEIDFSEKVAINGTPFPADDERGIPVAIFRGTEAGLNERNLQKFFRRMCGTKENFDRFISKTGSKNCVELKEALQNIYRLSAEKNVASFCWNRAIISLNDAILPAENQRKAWCGGVETVLLDAPHFSEEIFNGLIS